MVAVLSRVSPPLKWHGGKYYLAPTIVGLMPKHIHYVEPYAGGLSVLFAKDPTDVSEVVNDSNKSLTNFWRVLQSEELFARFQRQMQAMPFSEVEWRDAATPAADSDPVAEAVRFFVRCRQSLAGRMKGFAPLSRRRTRSDMNEQASAWLNAVDGLPDAHDRLSRVAILDRDALEVIRKQDGPGTLFYLDPPYLQETRAAKAVYEHEMDAGQHEQLLDTILKSKGKVMLSGYPSELYDRKLHDWTRHEVGVSNHAAGGKTKRLMTEVVWCNFE